MYPDDADPWLGQPELDLHVEADARSSTSEIVRDADIPTAALTALHAVAADLIRLSGPELLTSALRRIFDMVPAAQRISLVAWPPRHDEQGGVTFVPLIEPLTYSPQGRGGAPVSRTLMTRAVESGKALLFSHTQDRENLGEVNSIKMLSIRSAIYVPLLGQHEVVLGVLCVDTPRPWQPFGVPDFHFVRALAALLAAALDAQRLRDEVRARDLEARDLLARREAMAAFLKIATHDLKGPVGVMQMAVDVLQQDALPHQQPFLRFLSDAATSTQRLVDSYLEVCAIESGAPLQLSPSELDLAALVEGELGLVRQMVREERTRDLLLVNEVESGTIVADPDKLRQIVANLLSNACKYSPHGGRVRVASRCVEGGVEVSVSDSGLGISDEDQARLFQQFVRVGDPTLAPGTGLGLWLVRALVEAHGGSVRVMSELGCGSTFTFLIAQPLPGPDRA